MRAALERMGPAAGRFAFAIKVEERLQAVLARIRPGRVLPANIEITAAIRLDALCIPREGFTPVFCGRPLSELDRACAGAAEDRANVPSHRGLRGTRERRVSRRNERSTAVVRRV